MVSPPFKRRRLLLVKEKFSFFILSYYKKEILSTLNKNTPASTGGGCHLNMERKENYSMKKLAILALSAILLMSGCKQVGSTVEKEDGYYSETRMSEMEYQVFVAKQISPVKNNLLTHIATATNIANGEYTVEDEHKNILVTLEIVDDSIEKIEGMGEAIGYENYRINLLEHLEEARKHLNEYDEYITGTEEIDSEVMSSFASKLKNDFTVIEAS